MNFKVTVSILTLIFALTVPLINAQQAQEPQTDQQTSGELERQRASVAGIAAAEIARANRGLRIAPVTLNLDRKNAFMVGLGSYIVNAQGGCNDCHTSPSFAPGGDPFKGEEKRVNAEHYLAGGTPFGPFVSRNLTPDSTTGLPAGLTYDQFRETIRTGTDLKKAHPDVSPLLQVMPWPVYQTMTERDLRAVYEYLAAIPHAEPGTSSAQ